jgi:hypothetical protein
VTRIVRRTADRTDGIPVHVTTDSQNRPVTVQGVPVLQRLTTFREWIGILDGEPQRDVWRVETARGICELHYLSYPDGNTDTAPGSWLLVGWED